MVLDLFRSLEGFGGQLQVRVTPKAAKNRIKIEEQPDGKKLFRVYVTTVPEGGRANKEVIKLLAKEFGLPTSAFTITHGSKTKDKTIRITRG